MRAQQRLQTTDDLTPYDEGVPFRDTAVQEFEDEAAARAFHSLPERWQLVLWHVEVEGQRPAEVAPLLGVKANAVSALAYRAREGLRAAYLNMHTPDDLRDEECRWVHDHLGGYVRDSLLRARHPSGPRAPRRLRGVRRELLLELASVNSEMRALIQPGMLGGAAAAYLGGGKAAGGLGLATVLGRTRDLVAAHAKTAAVLGVGSTVAAATITTALVRHDARPDPPAADDRGANVITTSRSAEPTLTTSPTRPADKASNAAATATATLTDSPSSASPNTSPSASPSARSSKRISATPSGTASAQAGSTTGSTTGSSVPTADVGVTVGPSGRSGTVTTGRWLVTGVPLGKTVSLTISAPASVALSSTDCTGAGTHLSCRVGNGAGVFQAVNSSGAQDRDRAGGACAGLRRPRSGRQLGQPHRP